MKRDSERPTKPAPPPWMPGAVTSDKYEAIRWAHGWECSDGTKQTIDELIHTAATIGPGPYKRLGRLSQRITKAG